MRETEFLRGTEPDKMPVEWEDPKTAVAEWSIRMTPRVLHGMKNENPNKGRPIARPEKSLPSTLIEKGGATKRSREFTPIEHYTPCGERNFEYSWRDRIAEGYVLTGNHPEIIAISKIGETILEPVHPVTLTLPRVGRPVTLLNPQAQNKNWVKNPLLPI